MQQLLLWCLVGYLHGLHGPRSSRDKDTYPFLPKLGQPGRQGGDSSCPACPQPRLFLLSCLHLPALCVVSNCCGTF